MSERWAPKKPNFGKPPPGYIPGLGRGAVGFITRGDVGPTKIPETKNINTNQIQQGNYAEAGFDEWQGQKGALFSKGNLDDEDKQAEDAYDFCQKRMWERRQKQRRQKQEQFKKQPLPDNSITSKFIDLKRQLAKVSVQQWQSLPQCVDLSIKKRKRDRFMPVPDSLIMGVLSNKEGIKSLEVQDENIQDFREAKEVLLKSKLDNLENSVAGKSNIDKIGYITQLNSKKLDADLLSDTKKARLLLKSALASNPKNPDIWLSAARVEEIDGKIKECRQLLRKAIEQIPLNQDIWLELSRVQKPELSKNVLIQGLRYLPSSQKLWLYAALKQSGDKQMKSKILRKGLQNISTSVKLWRQLIQLEDMQQAKNLLYKAVQSLPKEVDLWLALAKIQEYKNAQKVLNKARKCNPLNVTIWISAARLQEAQSKVQPIPGIFQKIQNVLLKARQVLKKNGANISRQQWLQQALIAQKGQSLIVCEMLVKISVGYGLTEQEINNVLFKDVRFYEKEKESNYATRFLYLYGIKITKNKQLMKQMIEFQNRKRIRKQHNQLDKTLEFSLQMFGWEKDFWKTIINKVIKQKQYDSALKLISKASTKLEKTQEEQIRLLKVQIFVMIHKYEEARKELQQLRTQFPKGQCIFQSIRFQYQIGDFQQAWELCQQHFKQSKNQNIWRLAFRIKQKVGSYSQAYTIIEKANNFFPESLLVWKDIIQLQVQQKHISKARALVDKASQKLPKSEEIQIVAIQLQRKFGTKKQSLFALSKAMKQFPKSPQIWAIGIELEPQNTRKKKASSAIEVCGQSAFINSSVAKLFWKQNKMDKAKRWFQQALKLSPINGDIWALYIRFLQIAYPSEKQQAVNRMMSTQQKLQGRQWKRVQQGRGGWKLHAEQILQILMKKVDGQINSLN